jgi:sugar phosphate isomerase/epimerase
MVNLISVSSAPVAGFGDKEYYDLAGTLEVLKRVFKLAVVDGFELQLEPEWDNKRPPLTDTDWADWTKTPKFTAEEIIKIVKEAKLPILSVHASRDVGNYLCSEQPKDCEKGKRIMRDALSIAERLGASVCVFHLWDTWKTSFSLDRVGGIFQECADEFPSVKASVENIPTHMEGSTPFELVKGFRYLTLDLRWAALYKELDKFEEIVKNIVNVHLRGCPEADRWIMERSSFDFYEALNRIVRDWKYVGLLTVEPEGKINGSMFGNFIEAMRSLKRTWNGGGGRSVAS